MLSEGFSFKYTPDYLQSVTDPTPGGPQLSLSSVPIRSLLTLVLIIINI
jgi:hypothetical protein